MSRRRLKVLAFFLIGATAVTGGACSKDEGNPARLVVRVKAKPGGSQPEKPVEVAKDNSVNRASVKEPPPVPSKAVPDNVVGEKKPVSTDNALRVTSTYLAFGKRDPFIPFIKGEDKTSKEELERLPPLQRYELADLKLVGVLWGKKGYKALVEDNEGKGYSVVLGSRIGRNKGVAVKIDSNSVQVREEFIDYLGSTVVKESELILPSNAGGK